VKKHRVADLLKLRKKENRKKDGEILLNIEIETRLGNLYNRVLMKFSKI